jgi:hypothetical protein
VGGLSHALFFLAFRQYLTCYLSRPLAPLHAFPAISIAFDSAVILWKLWQFVGSLTDTTKQTVITQLMKEHTSRQFRFVCSPAEQDRLAAVGFQTIPARCSESLLSSSPSSQPDYLSQYPLNLLNLMCPFELSDQAFVTCLSICLGIPVSHARILRTQPDYSAIDQWADFLLNDSAHVSRSRHASHDKLAYLLADLAFESIAGVYSSAAQSTLPRTNIIPSSLTPWAQPNVSKIACIVLIILTKA